MDKICPLMSKRVHAKGAYDQDITEMHYENCVKEKCAWWIDGISKNHVTGISTIIRHEGCAIKVLALKQE